MNPTDEEIRIKVAEAMGWKWNTSTDIGGKAFPECWTHDDHGFAWQVVDLPNYPADLNACAEFEATLTDEEWNIYSAEIVSLTLWDRATDTVQRILQATARQRCNAYLKTKGIIP